MLWAILPISSGLSKRYGMTIDQAQREDAGRAAPRVKQNRSFGKYVLLSVATFTLYHYFFLDAWVKDINLLCRKDGDHSVGVGGMLLASLLTFGIYKFVWIAKIVDRIYDSAVEYDVDVRQDGETFFLWVMLLPVFGYLIAMYQAIGDTNRLAEKYEIKRKNEIKTAKPSQKHSPTAARGALYGLRGTLAGKRIEITSSQPLKLGRSTQQGVITVEGMAVGRVHCTIQYNGERLGYCITDYSLNGVSIDGKQIPRNVPTYAPAGSVIALADGGNQFRLL